MRYRLQSKRNFYLVKILQYFCGGRCAALPNVARCACAALRLCENVRLRRCEAFGLCGNVRFWEKFDGALRKYSERFEPMKPAEPVIKIFELGLILCVILLVMSYE